MGQHKSVQSTTKKARYSMIVAYVRVSSRAQDHTMQRVAIERAASARGESITKWYAEKRSARTIDRAELDRLRADARRGLIKKLYLFRLDRLTRTGVRDTLDLVEEFKRHGVEIATISDGFDLSGPAAEIILCVMAWAARMERVALNERIAAARDRLESEGRSWGRPPSLDEGARARVAQLRGEGKAIRQIAIELKISKSVVARALKVSRKHQSENAHLADAKCSLSQAHDSASRGLS